MQQTPLGMDEETWAKRHEVVKKMYKNDKAWSKGYNAGKKGSKNKENAENPYVLSQDILELLRKRTRWFLGFEEGWATYKVSHKRRRSSHKDEQIEHIKEITKPKKHKHGHKHKHRKH